MAANLAQRRAAKALRRKAAVRAKRQVELRGQGEVASWGDGESWAEPVPTYKASAALIDFAEPLLDDDDDHHARYNSLMLAMLAWNLSLLDPGKRKENMRSILEAVPELLGEGDGEVLYQFENLITELISRKLMLYPFDRRCLVNFELRETSDGWRVNVASTLAKAA